MDYLRTFSLYSSWSFSQSNYPTLELFVITNTIQQRIKLSRFSSRSFSLSRKRLLKNSPGWLHNMGKKGVIVWLPPDDSFNWDWLCLSAGWLINWRCVCNALSWSRCWDPRGQSVASASKAHSTIFEFLCDALRGTSSLFLFINKLYIRRTYCQVNRDEWDLKIQTLHLFVCYFSPRQVHLCALFAQSVCRQ